eukprot:1136982-Pyramimonas_sp.AAC.1
MDQCGGCAQCQRSNVSGEPYSICPRLSAAPYQSNSIFFAAVSCALPANRHRRWSDPPSILRLTFGFVLGSG